MRSTSKSYSAPLFLLVVLNVFFLAQSLSEAESKKAERTRNDALKQNHSYTPLHVNLVWHDNYRLAPYSYATMSREVARIFEKMGVDVHWKVGMETDEDEGSVHQPLTFSVILLPSTAPSWGLKEDVMGVATYREGEKGSVYLFFPQIMDTLRFSETKTPRSMVHLGRAIGRVATHELVHVLAPYHPHTDGGLMNRNLTRNFLTRPRVRLDPVSSSVVRAELQALENPALLASGELTLDGVKSILSPALVRGLRR